MTLEDLSQSGATYEDTEGFIDFLRYLREVSVVFFMSELAGGAVKVSFRAKGSYDVNRIASEFAGGGHRKASGCVIRGALGEAEQKILQSIQRHYPNLAA